jgi:DNA-binding MarR family transcriptional regulator/GNAT superfamily N-acetyltransferase
MDQQIAGLRAFNRFYTSRIGVLVERPYGGDFSLAETRVLFELARRDGLQPSELAHELSLDRGYLSRILARFERAGLAERRKSDEDGRRVAIYITAAGRKAFAPINRSGYAAAADLLAPLPASVRAKVVAATETITKALGNAPAPRSFQLRDLAVGDVGRIIQRQALLYHEEYGWDGRYEGLVCEVLGSFVRNFDAVREKAWIAEQDGEIVGSIFLVKGDEPGVAKLRLLYVEPAARGQGVGARLVSVCIEAAREFGYRRIVLWTQSILKPAIRIYEAAGFQLVEEKPHHSFGVDLVAQTWALDL